MICNNCGGVIGVDCLNFIECLCEQIERDKMSELEEQI